MWPAMFLDNGMLYPVLPSGQLQSTLVGELARALRAGDPENLVHEFGDVLAWLGSLANLEGVDLEEAASRYASGCPKCGSSPCRCEFP